ncbi:MULTISPECIES: outer membrane protein [unclassified Ruegeria]|nr:MULTISPECIES: outer membrane beta-barrel protein [unclassified Ruegeria]NOE15338.1 outer membrane beta-barrel protein [Ruegeria sp. HKCCD4318-2]NOD63866.1 outer membrane beta-barrel protein [Ruegeria sp. HKCCD6109]NOD76310.1 outer membrane beta-barrel protein [Ruegeria sp. HKCCD4332]NOD90265.1 outer membrane beta-barrel protein [Ruegeria sp. HKCCD4318]NOG10452.1 porin family protein [Ruegeria sp. HKCCD4315]
MVSRFILTSAALMLGTTAATAQSLGDGTYVQGFIGYSQLQDSDFSGTIGGATQSVDTDFDAGFGLGVAIGKEIPQWSNDTIGTRIELELSYRDSDVDGVNFTGNGPAPEGNISGDVSQTSLFANILFDFKQAGALTPFAGFGLGATYSDLDFAYGPGVALDDSDTALAAQVIAGVAYDINPSTAFTVDARYARAFDVSSERLAPNGALTGTVEDDLDTFSVNFGLRYKF